MSDIRIPLDFVDRRLEVDLFNELLQLKDDARLLTITDKAGTGKTALLQMYRYLCKYLTLKPVSYVSLDDPTINDPFNLVARVREDLFTRVFGNFDRRNLHRLSNDFSAFTAANNPIANAGDVVSGSANTQLGTGLIAGTVIVNPVIDWTAEHEEFARCECIKAFFVDLASICTKDLVVILLDSYERCAPNLKEWILGPFLTPHCFDVSSRPARLVVAIAGRESPEIEVIVGDGYQQLVRSIAPLSAWREEEIKAVLSIHGHGALGDHDITFITRKVQQGLSIADALRLADVLENEMPL